jgi:heterotetrameric sarcosine oxidase delta subunit
MLLIPCPWCGERAEIEFVSGGERIPRPADPAALGPEAWTEYLYFRDNRYGVQAEHWWHAHGCRRWLVVERDTATQEILAVHSGEGPP